MTLLGVMVDLGWPWWVTTLIALSISAACAVVFVTSRSLAVRAVVATLAVQGIVLAAVAPFVMKENSSSAAAMHASPPAMKTSLTRAEFARRADANCTAFGHAYVAAGNPQTPAEIGRGLDRIVPVFRHGLAQQGALTPPPAERVTAKHWMNAMTATTNDLVALGRAGSARDAVRIKAANARLTENSARSARLSKQLGLKVC